jgi:hypothetical protein
VYRLNAAVALGPFIQKEHAVMGQRHLAWHRHVAATDQPHIRDGVVGGATRAGRDPRRAGAGEAGDAVDTPGLKGFGEGHCRQDGGDRPPRTRLVRPQTAEKEKVWERVMLCSHGTSRSLGLQCIDSGGGYEALTMAIHVLAGFN